MKLLSFLFVSLFFFTSAKAQGDYVSDYTQISYKTLSDLMWRHVHSSNDQEALKAYFQIHYCSVFEKYYQDDFQWHTIMEGFKRDLKYFSKEAPNKFYITAVIPVDRYDFAKSAFIVEDRFALDNAGSIQIPLSEKSKRLRCNRQSIDLSYFPRNMKFLADRKFSLTEIPMNPESANKLLSRIKKYKYEGIESDRTLTVRFLITLSGIDRYEKDGIHGEVVFKGSLDEIAFFEDPQLKNPVWKKQFRIFEE